MTARLEQCSFAATTPAAATVEMANTVPTGASLELRSVRPSVVCCQPGSSLQPKQAGAAIVKALIIDWHKFFLPKSGSMQSGVFPSKKW